jgi:hypothetical protein
MKVWLTLNWIFGLALAASLSFALAATEYMRSRANAQRSEKLPWYVAGKWGLPHYISTLYMIFEAYEAVVPGTRLPRLVRWSVFAYPIRLITYAIVEVFAYS